LALAKYAVKGRTFLFVGTKKPASNLISRAALFSQKSFFVNTRWLGGMLTNWKTILKSISKIRPILKEKQRIISALLSKRDEIKRRLINKILTAMKFIQKGRQFLEAIKTNNNFLVRNRAFFTKRKELVNKKKQLLLKRKLLLKKLSDWEMTSPRLKGQGLCISYATTRAALLLSKHKLEILQRNLPEYVLSNFENSLSSATQNIEKLAILTQLQHKAFQKRKGQMGFFIQTKKVFLVEMQNILVKLRSERQVMNILKKKMKRLAAEKRCLTALPKCQRILTISHGAASAPTPADLERLQVSWASQASSQLDTSNSVEILMQKFVDPKLKQATTSLQIFDDILKNKSKKIATAQRKKWIQLERYFGGISNMLKMKKSKISQNVAIIVGQNEELNAIAECSKLGIKMFSLVDSDSLIGPASHVVPANDDSHHSIKFILGKFLKHIRLAQKLRLRLNSAAESPAL
jgi:ribosomal protein S2